MKCSHAHHNFKKLPAVLTRVSDAAVSAATPEASPAQRMEQLPAQVAMKPLQQLLPEVSLVLLPTMVKIWWILLTCAMA